MRTADRHTSIPMEDIDWAGATETIATDEFTVAPLVTLVARGAP